MEKPSVAKVIIQLILLIAVIVTLSVVATKTWDNKLESIPVSQELIFEDDMTIVEFGQKNKIPNPLLKKIFGLRTKQNLQKKLDEFNLSREHIAKKVDQIMVLKAEHESKNWIRIPVKFGLWFIFLFIVFIMMRKAKITPKYRRTFYLTAIAVFGIILGSDPSPMGPVKDTIVLYGAKGVLFPPRMIALTIFLTLALLANKFICSWGCQLGTLQDMIFRLNRNTEDSKGIFRQYKPPFYVTNTFRVLFFAGFTLIAFLWKSDIINSIDPFKIYKSAMISVEGWIFVGGTLIVSLVIYRPWCHLFCPFGLVSWLVEKISIFKIKVDYATCTACEACTKACPSTAMEAILKQENVIPDCFTCSTCINVCPTDSIKLCVGKRTKPTLCH